MANTTVRQLAYDILNQFGYNHDDADRNYIKVAYNIKVCLDKLAADGIKKDISKGDFLATQHEMSIWTVDLLTDANRGWRYFDLPGSVYELPKDGGIASIYYYRPSGLPANCPPQVARVKYRPVALSWLESLWKSRWQYVDESQPVYARASVGNADRVYVFGQDEDIDQLEAHLFLAMPNIPDLNLDDNISLPDNRIHTLKRMVIELERWALMVPQQRLKNDGRDMEPGQVVNTPPAVSVNDPINADE